MSCLSPEQSLLVRRNKILAPLLVEEEEEEEEEKAHEVSNPASFLWHCTHANKEVEFAKLNVYSKQYPKHYDYPHLNRFRELPALLNSRVVLNNGDCEYINANFLPVRSKGGGLILTRTFICLFNVLNSSLVQVGITVYLCAISALCSGIIHVKLQLLVTAPNIGIYF
jgi:protein tyrosine phosphatase